MVLNLDRQVCQNYSMNSLIGVVSIVLVSISVFCVGRAMEVTVDASEQLFKTLNSLDVVDVTSSLKPAPISWPYLPRDFKRRDESVDSNFYDEPRLVYHIDEGAVESLRKYYSIIFRESMTYLDICSSWVSHYPTDLRMHRSIGLGMNEIELKQNPELTEIIVHDLNVNPVIPLESTSVDYVTCVVSIDYLIHPLEILREVHRVLKTGGVFVISQSNRCFPSKAINIWLRTDDMGHLSIIRDYFHFAGGFKNVVALDISRLSGRSGGDPMYIVQGTKV